MKKQLSFFICLTLIVSISNAQLENNNWCFREFAGLTFTGLTPAPFITAVPKSGFHNPKPLTSASVSDQNGNLLFYTNGITVWDNGNQPMLNGNLLYGDATCVSIQTVVIVPKPGSQTLYYIFTISTSGLTNHSYNGIYYSIVDMTLNNGHGDIVSGFKNIPLKNHNGQLFNYNLATSTGDILIQNTYATTTLNCTKDKIWLTIFTFYTENNNYKHYAHEYLISDVGINNISDGQSPMPTVSILLTHEPIPQGTCPPHYIKFSPDSKYLCDANPTGVSLFDFDNATGQLTMNRTIVANDTYKLGIDFSPNSRLVYYSSDDGNIYQNLAGKSPVEVSGAYRKIDIWQYNINGSLSDTPIIVGSIKLTANSYVDNTTPIPQQGIAANIQLAVNNKLYICAGTGIYGAGSNFLSSIDNPNQPGLGCTFIQNSVQLLSNMYQYGNLPQWVHKAGPTIPCGQALWPKVYIAADGFLGLKQTIANNIITLANVINMSNNINHVGPVSNSSQEVLNWIHYDKSNGITKWTNSATTPYAPFSLSNGQLQYCHYPSTPFYIDEQNGNTVNGPGYLPVNCGQIVAEDNGDYVAYEGNHLSIYSPLRSRYINLPFATNGYSKVKAYFNQVSKKLFFLFYGNANNPNSYLVIYSLNNGMLIPQYNAFYLLNYEVVGVNTSDELFVLNTNRILQKFDYINNTFTTLQIPNFGNQSLIAINTDEQTVSDNLLFRKDNDYNIYAINTLSLNGRACSNTFVGSYPNRNYGVYDYFFDNSGQNVFVSGTYNTNNYTIANQSMTNISVGSYFGQSTFLTKLNLTSDFATLKMSPPNESVSISFDVQKSVIKTYNDYDNKAQVTISQNPVKDILRIKVSVFNKVAYPVSGYVTNNEGKKVLSMSVINENNAFNVSILKPGIYYFSLLAKDKVVTTKLFLKE